MAMIEINSRAAKAAATLRMGSHDPWQGETELDRAKAQVMWAMDHGTAQDVEDAVMEYGILWQELS